MTQKILFTIRACFFLTSLMLLPGLAKGEDLRTVFSFGYDNGGDELLWVEYTDGSRSDIKAGSGFWIAGGIEIVTDLSEPRTKPHTGNGVNDKSATKSDNGNIDSDDRTFASLRLTVGFKIDTVKKADNGDADFKRFPLEALVLCTIKKHHFGVGFTYHVNPELSTEGFLGDANIEFDDALGFVLQYGYWITDRVGLAARYTMLDYEASGTPSDIKADSLGANLTLRF